MMGGQRCQNGGLDLVHDNVHLVLDLLLLECPHPGSFTLHKLVQELCSPRIQSIVILQFDLSFVIEQYLQNGEMPKCLFSPNSCWAFGQMI
jgi:hypothetical protein